MTDREKTWERQARTLLRDMAIMLDGMNAFDGLVREIARHGYSKQLAHFVGSAARLAERPTCLTPAPTVWTTEEILAREG